MKKTIKNIVVCLLIMFAVIESNGISVNAAESIKAEHEETNYAIGYLVPTTSTYSFTEEGGVATDGLRLRKEPSFDSTILELMYFGEVVKIDLDKSTMTFYYVERVKTGTKGYANTQYIQILEYVR
ncbi:MAG: SH3 domain-containing protein [Roseburia faecis]|jgi:SH3 domain protein|uniref:SH3 domain-containing protein n=1 Tax=Roseburia faecis TaxID=301302 RepID=UPI001898C354|nr:SH3 domain-containing protein [Roseburia faecis]